MDFAGFDRAGYRERGFDETSFLHCPTKKNDQRIPADGLSASCSQVINKRRNLVTVLDVSRGEGNWIRFKFLIYDGGIGHLRVLHNG
jgi:hypothetical protein